VARTAVDRRELGEACLLGCSSRQTGAPVRCTPPLVICDRCVSRLTEWLEGLPQLRTRLGTLVARGSLPAEGIGGKVTKKAHAPMPIRPEVVALLDDRGDESVAGRLRKWAGWVAACRGLRELPTWRLDLHLPWLAQQQEIVSFYHEVRTINRQCRWAAGDRPPATVGVCGAQVDGEACGGPLLPLKYSVGVRCSWCGDEWQEGDLRGLGNLLQQRWVPVQVAAFLASRPESTLRDWLAEPEVPLPAQCDLGTRQVLVDALALAPLTERRRKRTRRRSA